MEKLEPFFSEEGDGGNEYGPWIPNVQFNPQNGVFEITGDSIGVRYAYQFIGIVFAWLEDYNTCPHFKTTLVFNLGLTYENGAFFFNIIEILKDVPNLKVIWRYSQYQPDEEDKKLFQECKELLKISIELEEV